jgi:paraquat-inducible protein B
MSDERSTIPSRAMAKIRRTHWPGWIWAVPVAAFVTVGGLAIHALTSRGTEVTIVFDEGSGVKDDSDVIYRGTKIGSVEDAGLTEDGNAVEVHARISKPASRFLTTGTRFWLEGAHPSLEDPSSLRSILSGSTIVMEPGPGRKATHFKGLGRKPIAPAAGGSAERYRVTFDGDVGALKRGDAVKLRGFTVGQVEEIELHVDADRGAIRTPVTLRLFTPLLPITSANPDQLRAAVSSLVRHGLRARLERDPPLIGSYEVTLDMVSGAPATTQPSGSGLPEIPAMPGGGIDSLVTRIDKVPVDRIADHVLSITDRVDALVSSAELRDSLVQLDAALKQIRRTAASAGPKIERLVDRLRDTADHLDRTAKSAATVVGGPAAQNGIDTTMHEVTDAARAIRELADYLDRHPEALIRGRSGEP